jgi:hypothetical protein
MRSDFQRLIFAVVVLGVLMLVPAPSFATSIYSTCTLGSPCTFDMSGRGTVTATTITWNSDAVGNAPDFFTLTAGTGVFSTIPAGSQESIQNLNLATEPVGTMFAPMAFISFPTAPTLPALLINFIFAGIYSSATCGGTPAVGQQCTPPGSPFNFVNNPGGPTGVEATATFVFKGVSADGAAANWSANFTSQFNVPFQTILAAFAPGGSGSQSNSYSATTTVTIAAIPEPQTTALVLGGLLVLLGRFGMRRYSRGR